MVIVHGARVPPYVSDFSDTSRGECWLTGVGGMGMLVVRFSDAGDAENRRALTPGGTWFFTVNLLQRRRNDLLVRDIDLLRACVAAERSRRPFAIRAWVVLPEHMRWIWTLPVGDADFPTRWRRIKTDFSLSLARTERRSAVRVSRGERGIWQRRYWEHQMRYAGEAFRDEVDYARHFDYIHYNPVKHGWARSPALWPHSSFGEMVARGVYDRDWASSVAFDLGGDG